MRLHYTNKAEEQLRSLPRVIQVRIREKLDFYLLQKDPLVFAKPLSGFPAYRFRVGEYRIVFKLESDLLSVLLIKKRDAVYKNLQ